MKSCIYTGEVFHQRFGTLQHGFHYKLFLMFLDLDELKDVFQKSWFWSLNKINIATFRREDYHGDPSLELKDEVLDTVEKKTGIRFEGPVRMLTHLRYFGHCFNPVTFYYCYKKDGISLGAIMAEIENTPWGERFCYVCLSSDSERPYIESQFEKEFHVSPFFPMSLKYSWKLKVPDKELKIKMESREDNKKVFNVVLNMKRRPISGKELNLQLLKYPLMTIKVVLGIYLQAFKLWCKGVSFFAHPNKESQKELTLLKGRSKDEK